MNSAGDIVAGDIDKAKVWKAFLHICFHQYVTSSETYGGETSLQAMERALVDQISTPQLLKDPTLEMPSATVFLCSLLPQC